MRKRIFTSLLAIAMVMAMIPAALAEEPWRVEVSNGINFTKNTTQEDLDQWAEGAVTLSVSEDQSSYTFTLNKDIRLADNANNPLTFGIFDYGEGKGEETPIMILDLNGHTVDGKLTVVANMGNLVIRDSIGTGRIVLDNRNSYMTAVQNAGYKLTIEGGTFVCKGAGSASYNAAVNSTAGAITEINGGALEGTNGPALVAYGEVTLNGGTITGTYGIVSKANSDGTAAGKVTIPENSTVVVNTEKQALVVSGNNGTTGQIFVKGGSVSVGRGAEIVGRLGNAETAGNVVVSGGQFSTQVPESCLDGSVQAQIKKPNGTYTYYTDLEEAKEAAQPGDTLMDLSGDTPEEIVSCTVIMRNGENVEEKVVWSGDVITLDTLPNSGFNYFQGWLNETTKQIVSGEVTITGDTTFTAQWAYIPPIITNPSYGVTVAPTVNGTVTVSPAAAQQGQTVTVTAAPNEGYELSALTVTDRFGNTVMTQANPNGTYSFVMPGSQVTVSAVFVEKAPDIWVNPFVDVAANDWFYPYVEYVCRNGLMEGTSAVTFDPSGTVTRGTVATILWRLAGSPVVNYQMTFPDVAEGEWYSEAVRWAASEGVITGYDNGNFGPNDPITREQLAVMLYRYAQKQGEGFTGAWAFPLDYADAEQVSAYAYEAMCWMTMKGVVNGRDGLLAPQGTATRAELAAMLMRFCENI